MRRPVITAKQAMKMVRLNSSVVKKMSCGCVFTFKIGSTVVKPCAAHIPTQSSMVCSAGTFPFDRGEE